MALGVTLGLMLLLLGGLHVVALSRLGFVLLRVHARS
jgi:hypothetical protein